MRMTKLWILALAALVLFTGCSVWEKRETEKRVTAMMEGWRTGGTGSGGDMQEAVSMWWKGVRFIPDDLELDDARKRFDSWRRVKGLYKKIETWEITSMAKDGSTGGNAMIVSMDIDGRSYRMRVPEGDTISWVK